jgi:hypothetical protein
MGLPRFDYAGYLVVSTDLVAGIDPYLINTSHESPSHSWVAG